MVVVIVDVYVDVMGIVVKVTLQALRLRVACQRIMLLVGKPMREPR